MDLSLYIHVPFCVAKCRYCDFASGVFPEESRAGYVDTLCAEMELRAATLPAPVRIPTLYIGGGTPSLLAPGEIARLIDRAAALFSLEESPEITMEANPGTLSAASAAGFRAAGVNRLSLGVQSLDDRMLALLGRIHTAQEARQAVATARRAGFDNIGIDLIHSLPGQSLSDWQKELAQGLAMEPTHISAYGLTLEEGTPLYAAAERGEVEPLSGDDSALQFEATAEILVRAGFEHYEISNFSRPGFRSRHNQVYWRRGHYLGLGCAAHSFLPESPYGLRRENPRSLEEYRAAVATGDPFGDGHPLSHSEAVAEWVFLGLRLLEGVDTEDFRREFGIPFRQVYGSETAPLIEGGLLVEEGGRLRLSPRGILLSNRVLAAFV